MKLLTSKRFKLPTIYFITDRDELSELPIGVPFIYGDKSTEEQVVRLLEYEVLYQEALKTGFPFNFKLILEEKGFKDLKSFNYGNPVYMDYKKSDDNIFDNHDIKSSKNIFTDDSLFKEFVKDSSTFVDIAKLKSLTVFPIWLDKIEEAVKTNIHNFAVFNDYMYNKKLDGMYGGMDLVSPNKNLIIIDISSSIPRAVSSTCLTLAKFLSETFYCDLLITASKSILYSYNEIQALDIKTLYQMGMGNEQNEFKALLTKDERHYDTCIAFGDNDWPGYPWNNGSNRISDKDGKAMCKWKVNKLISFHTKSTYELAGYSRWFDVPKANIESISNWVKYLD